jgi:photosystem II stability/assembly factor-like uncharacterized protein
MRYTIYLFFSAFLLISQFLYSQHTWEWLNPHPQGNMLNDCAIVRDSTLIVIGSSGTFFISFDNGNSWSDNYALIGNSVNLNSVSFFDDENGIIVGGFIVTTTDGGKSWSEKYSVSELLCVDYISSKVAYASGHSGMVLKSEDKGIRWTTITTPTIEDLNGISFINPDTGIVVGNNGKILKTLDGGSSWQDISINDFDVFLSVSMITNEKIIVGGLNGAFYKSINGGLNWDKINGPLLDVLSYSDISYADTNNIFVCGGYSFTGSYCTIVKSTDGGESWSLAYEDLHPIYLTGLSANDGKIRSVGFDGQIFSSDDNGSNWKRLSSGNTSVIIDFDMLDSLNIIALTRDISKNTIYTTTDGGDKWNEYNIPTVQPLNSISFCNEGIGFVAGSWSNVFKSTDRGVTWNKLDLGGITDTNKFFYSVDVIDSLNCFIVGDTGVVLKSTDGGKSWSEKIITSYSLYDISFSDLVHGYAIGWTKTFYTTDSGSNWEEGLNNNDHLLWSVSAVDKYIAYTVGDAGTVLKTADGGKHWEDRSTGSGFSFNGVSFYNKDIGVAVGGFGSIYLTSDAGNLWLNLTGRTFNQLYSVRMIDSKTAIISGESGTVTRMRFDIPTNVVVHANKTPGYYILGQNYPNPFNPMTKINYSISHTNFVTIKVFDSLGREVATLVNEEKSPGNYEIRFYGNNLSSGVYFYRMQAGSYSEVKKLILLK